MERTIIIDERPVRFKSTGAFLLRYKAQFKRDALKDLVKLEPIISKLDKKIILADDATEEQKALAQEQENENAIEAFDSLDLELFYNMAWVMAKTADPSIAEPMVWLDTFGEFPVMDIFTEIQDVLSASIQVSKKK